MLVLRPCFIRAAFGVLVLSLASKQTAQAVSQKDAPTLDVVAEIDVPVSRLQIAGNAAQVDTVLKGDDYVTKKEFDDLEKRVVELEGKSSGDESRHLASVEAHQSDSSDMTKPFRQQTNGSTPTGWIQIGTPKKWLNVIFDTGSDKLVAKTWETVAAELRSLDPGAADLVMPSDSIYNHLSSTSYHGRTSVNVEGEHVPVITSITYGSGSVVTNEGTETVHIGNRHVEDFELLEVDTDTLSLLHTATGISGILGLQHMRNKSLGNSLFSEMRDADLLSSFGYCRGTGNNGTFIWGDDSTEGQELDVFGQMHWALNLGDVAVHLKSTESSGDSSGDSSSKSPGNSSGSLIATRGTRFMTSDGKSVPSGAADMAPSALAAKADEMLQEETFALHNTCKDNKCTAILDTGSNIIAGPREAMKAISKLVRVKSDCSNFDDLGDIMMKLGNMTVTIPPRGYVMKVPKPAGGWPEHDDGDEKELDDVEPSIMRRENNKAMESDMGLAEEEASLMRLGKKALRSRDLTHRRWRGLFEQLHRNRGVDLREAVDMMLEQNNGTTHNEFLCMPALVPLDKKTINGPLFIVGSPLLEAYYARWSFAKDDSSPKIHLKALEDTKVCQGEQFNEEKDDLVPPLVQPQHKLLQVDGKFAEPSDKRGPIVRPVEEIAYPHWAKDLLHV